MVVRSILSLLITALITTPAAQSFAQNSSAPSEIASTTLNYSSDPARLVTIGQINWIVRNCRHDNFIKLSVEEQEKIKPRCIAIKYQQDLTRDQNINFIQLNQKCTPAIYDNLKKQEQKQLKLQCDDYNQTIERRRIQAIHINTLKPYFAAQDRLDSQRDVYEHRSAADMPQVSGIVITCWPKNLALMAVEQQQQIKPMCDFIARQLAEQRVRRRIEAVLQESFTRNRNPNNLLSILQGVLQKNNAIDAKDAVLNPQ